MKIDQPNVAGSTQVANVASSSGQRKYAALGSSGDHAELSGLSRAIQTSQSNRAARVDQLKSLVQSGQYDANPARISSAIVNEAVSAAAR